MLWQTQSSTLRSGLTIARPLADGKVKIDGVDGTFHSAPIETEIFRGMIADRCFDVGELVLTYFLRTFKDGKSPFVAILIFPNPALRHPAIFINKASSIKTLDDLNGKRFWNGRRTASLDPLSFAIAILNLEIFE